MGFYNILGGLVLVGSSLATTGASGQEQSLEMCLVTKKVIGGYTFEPRPDLDIRRSTSRPGPFRLPDAKDVVGVMCLRESIVPQDLDLEVLQGGYDFGVAVPDESAGGPRTLYLKLEGRTVDWEMLEGELTLTEQEQVGRALARMNARLAAGPR